MNSALILVGTVVIFIIAYNTYGSYIARVVGLDDKNITPAHSLNDGVDYIPAPAPVVMGHHFATIAGAGPIVGPILAVYFGWLPALIWILVGAVLMGAVHDFLALVASMRHEGRSIASIIEMYIGKPGKKYFLLFSFPTLILVIAVFMNVVVKTFVAHPAVGTSSILFVFLAIGFGIARDRFNASLLPSTIISVILMGLCVWAGIAFPLLLSKPIWLLIISIYIFFASIAPVSFLLQPRDYLNSYLLYAVMLMALLGILVYHPDTALPPFTSFEVGGNYMFPILFVTIACGALSGFHSLAASGTTSKQIDKESHAKPIGYGAMLIEGLLAVVALISVAYLTPEAYAGLKSGGPVAIFANGVGTFASKLGIPLEVGIIFAAMAISSFALTTLDSCVRLARFAFQEYFSSSSEELKQKAIINNPVTGTAIATVGGIILTLSGGATVVWPVFGAANQLLGALAFLATSVWLEKTGRESLFAKIPMVIMFAVSLSALALLALQNIEKENWSVAVLAVMLFTLGCSLAFQAYSSLKNFRNTPVADLELEPATQGGDMKPPNQCC